MTLDLAALKQLGIVGAGGAGFPAHVKLAARPEILIVNAAECEPLLHKDGEILRNHTEAFLAGLALAQKLCGAQTVIIGIKKKHGETIALLSAKIPAGVRIAGLDDFYPAGDEVTLVYKLTGRVIQPGALPITCGCLVQNVETILNIGRTRPVTTKFLTIAGAVEQGATFEVPIGMRVRELLSAMRINAPNHAVVADGVMMGRVDSDPDAVVTKRSGGFIILPAEHAVVRTLLRSRSDARVELLAKASCDQCSYCTELCPRYLLGHPVRPEIAMRNRMFSTDPENAAHAGNSFCCECNLCTLYACPEHLDPRGACRIEKTINRKKNAPWRGLPVSSHPLAQYRETPSSRLKERLCLTAYDRPAPLRPLPAMPRSVVIMLQQHSGAPARPLVNVGDTVAAGQCIGEAAAGISAPVHASISGRVVAVDSRAIYLEA